MKPTTPRVLRLLLLYLAVTMLGGCCFHRFRPPCRGWAPFHPGVVHCGPTVHLHFPRAGR